MTKTIKIFLPNDFYDELLYQYEDKDADLRKLVFGYLKPLGKQGRLVKLNQMVQARIMKDGKMSMKDVELKNVDIDVHAVVSNDDWIPEKVTKEEVKVYEIQISDRLYDDLEYFGKIFCVRLNMYNESLDEAQFESKKAILPTCFEQIIQDNTVSQLSQAISENIDKDYDEEFAELEKNIKK